jgi:hypothetical protein
MKRLYIYRIVSLIAIFFVSTSMVNNSADCGSTNGDQYQTLLYEDVWGSIYHAEVSQCDSTPHVTADGSRINPWKASKHRWIAISQDLIYDEYRMKLTKPGSSRFRGKIQYGDTVWIDSPYPEINGWWVVCDAKNKRYTKSIDFLQTKDDKTLTKNYPLWPGEFTNIKIYHFRTNSYKILQNSLEV